MIVDQTRVIEVWPEALFTGGEAIASAEAYMDEDELDKVGDFLSTVAAVENATGLDFGKAVRDGDVRKGGAEESIDRFEEVPLARKAQKIAPSRPPTDSRFWQSILRRRFSGKARDTSVYQ